MAEIDDELQRRTCRACGQDYNYPARGSAATRFHCEACMKLPPAVRGTFEQYNKRVRDLARQVRKLEERLSRPSARDAKE